MRNSKTKTRKMLRRAAAILLTVTITVTGSYTDLMNRAVYAEKLNTEGEAADKITDDVTVVKELVEERTENSSTYLMSDGTKRLEWYADDIRYRENGKWKAYDSSLKALDTEDRKELAEKEIVNAGENEIRNRYKKVNTSGDSKQYFPTKLSKETPVIMAKDDSGVSFVPQMENDDSGMTIKSTGEDEISYTDGEKEIKYTSLTNGIKEDIIFNERPESNEVTFEYVLDGMYMELDEKTNVIKIYSDAGEEKAYISSPFLRDDTGINFSFDIEYHIVQDGDKWTVTEILDEEYLDSEKVKYPVTLDPNFCWMDSGSIEASNPMSGYPSDYVIPGTSEMLIGKISDGFYGQGMIRWNGLQEMIRGKYINYAILDIFVKEVVGNPVINVYPITEDWDVQEMTWNTKPDNSDELITTHENFIVGNQYNLNIKSWIKKISTGEITDKYGLALCTGTEEQLSYMRIHGTATNSKPILVIDYSEPVNISGKYVGDFNISGSYNEETGKIDVEWEEYSENTSDI